MSANDWLVLGALGVLMWLGYARGGGRREIGPVPPPSPTRYTGDLETYLTSPGPELFAGWTIPQQQAFLDATGRTYQDAPPGWSNLDWEDFLRGV